MEFIVKFTWHDDERIWLAESSSNNYGLTADSNSFDGLLEKVKIILADAAEMDMNYKGEIKLKLDVDHTVTLNTSAVA